MTPTASTPANASTAMATVLVDELVRCGVEHVVLAPGSRSAALAFAVRAAACAGRLRLHVRVDERTAGFLALGLAKTSHRPVPVVTTSGTAVANLHPAVLEAAHAGVPLLVLSADRPAGLRGTNANQTTDQVKIFGDAVRAFADLPPAHPGPREGEQVASWRSLVARLTATATGRAATAPGPVHLNAQFAEPLTPEPSDGWRTPCEGRPGGAAWTVTGEPARPAREPLSADRRTVVVAGDDAGPPARILAETAGWPLLAEPTSGSRTGANAIRTYRLLLGDDTLAARIERVVVCGHPTLSRPVTRLLSRADVEVVAVAAPTGWTDPGHAVSRVVAGAAGAAGAPGTDGAGGRSRGGVPTVDGPGRRARDERGWMGGTSSLRSPAAPDAPDTPDTPDAWLQEWLDRDADLSARLDALVDEQDGLTPHHVARAVSGAVPPRGLLFVGASNPVRDLDLMAARYPVGERRLVIANRGLAGIDGTVSSAVGAALARPDTSRAFALVGDVTFLHDSNGLVLGPDEPRPDLRIVVVNDDGGSIFASLEPGATSYADSFERLFGTPHGVDLAALCAATGTPHRRVTTPAELEDALAASVAGIDVVEAVVRRDDRRDLDAAIRALVHGSTAQD